jgi:predicted PurR-regulated permease PerM
MVEQPAAQPPPRAPDAVSGVTVTISRRTIFLVLGLIAGVWLVLHLVQLLIVLFAAVLLATSIDQPTGWLERRGLPRSVGALLLFLLLFLAFAGVVALLVPLLHAEFLSLQDDLPRYADQLNGFAQRHLPNYNAQANFSFSKLGEQASGHVGEIAGRLTTVTLAVGHTLVLIFATFVLAYFMAASPEMGMQFVRRFTPVPHQERAANILHAVNLRVGAWARGQLIIAVSFGLAMGLGLWAIGIPYAASLGTTAAVLELIPYVGGAITVVLAVLMALSVGPWQVLAVIVLYLVLINIEAHILAPVLLGRVIGLPSIAVLIALLAGVELLGILGALLAVPATVIVWAIIEELWPAPETPQPAAVRHMRGGGGRRPRRGPPRWGARHTVDVAAEQE